MWTEITRPQYERKGLRYTSDLTDAEWASIAPRLPPPRRLGRRHGRGSERREGRVDGRGAAAPAVPARHVP